MVVPDDDNLETTPQGTMDEQAAEVDYEKLSDEELERLARGEKPEEKKPSEEEKPLEEEEPAKEEETPPEGEPESREETVESLKKKYDNLRDLQSRQAQELGELRQKDKERQQLDEEMARYRVDASARNIVRQDVKKMSPEERSAFFDTLSDDPESALNPLIQRTLRPVLVTIARQTNEAEVRRLKEETKESVVPFDEKEVNKVIAAYNDPHGRNTLFEHYGSGAYEAAYKIYRDKNLDGALKHKLQEETERVKKESAKKGAAPHTESAGTFQLPGEPDYEKMPFDELEKLVEKTRRPT